MRLTGAPAMGMFEGEPRHPDWAPGMEMLLGKKLATLLPAKNPNAKVLELECHTTICKVVVDPDGQQGILENLGERLSPRFNPLSYGRNREAAFLIFDEKTWHPADYTSWSERNRLAQKVRHARPLTEEQLRQIEARGAENGIVYRRKSQ